MRDKSNLGTTERLSIQTPVELLNMLRRYSKLRKRSMTDIVNEGIEQTLVQAAVCEGNRAQKWVLDKQDAEDAALALGESGRKLREVLTQACNRENQNGEAVQSVVYWLQQLMYAQDALDHAMAAYGQALAGLASISGEEQVEQVREMESENDGSAVS